MVWAVTGGRVHRCSAHSVRPLTDHETVLHDVQQQPQEQEWRSLMDDIHKRDFVDLMDEIPNDEDRELLGLPDVPNVHTWISSKRSELEAVVDGCARPADSVNDYATPAPLEPAPEEDVEETGNTHGLPSRRSSVTSATPLLPPEEDQESLDYAPTTPGADAAPASTWRTYWCYR